MIAFGYYRQRVTCLGLFGTSMNLWFWLAAGLFVATVVFFLVLPSTWARLRRLVGGDAPVAAIDRLLSANRDVLEDNFSLCYGQRYRVLTNRPPLARDMLVTYRGAHQEPADRGWDYSHHFENANGELLVLPIDKTPRTIAESLRVFEDVEHADAKQWRNPSLMSGLYHRAKRIRERSATKLTSESAGIAEAVPRLYELALMASGSNPFTAALTRVAQAALPLVSELDDNVSAELAAASENILATLGSDKYVSRYREELYSADPIEVRRAVKRLAQVGDHAAEPRLQELAQHSNMNVRFAVRDALAKLVQLES